ncbi:hypothetical protein BDF20DRAFT_879096 [Mycotypha africana]|uniref:uncharacterized protein n=1 Tax=Mycotypha africana TaxID=64632 RepID=UPI0023014370|nr:uncharacterized protein BDF20DRAFT_879096 [Mycotypha africana]KAI8975514.1 hypothetical protein BDF20DRAFT_879096 [Mycotypha africana]
MVYQDTKLKRSHNIFLHWCGFDQFIPEQIVTSYWISPKVLLLYRIICALYTGFIFWFFVIVFSFWPIDLWNIYFKFFTIYSYVGLHAYFVTTAIYEWRYIKSKSVNFLLHRKSFWNYTFMYLYSTVVCFNILTPVIYWTLLSYLLPLDNFLSILFNVSFHILAFLMMFFDVWFTRMRLPKRLVIFTTFTVFLYMIEAFIDHAIQGTWVYPFMDWKQGFVAFLYYLYVGNVEVAAFFIMKAIHILRDRLAYKLGKAEAAVNFPEHRQREEHAELNTDITRMA